MKWHVILFHGVNQISYNVMQIFSYPPASARTASLSTLRSAFAENRVRRCLAAVSVRCTLRAVSISVCQRYMRQKIESRDGARCARWTTWATAERDYIKMVKTDETSQQRLSIQYWRTGWVSRHALQCEHLLPLLQCGSCRLGGRMAEKWDKRKK